MSRRVLTTVIALAMVMALVPALWASASFASTSDELDVARAHRDAARETANEAVAAFSAAENKLAETEQRIEELETSINELKAKAQELQGIVRQRAVYAYTHKGQDLDIVVDAGNPVEAARRSQLLDQANERDNTAVRKLAAVNEDLRDQQDTLKEQESQQAAVKSQLQTKLNDLQAKLADAQAATNALQGKLDAEIAAAKAADDAARRQALEAERLSVAATQTVSDTGPGQIIGTPIGGFQCPVSGAAYSDDFGGARGHPGIDMFVPEGTAAVAVKSGTVSYVANEGAGGNTAYLNASDGNTYFYAHLSSFVGGARSVSQGEIIGLTGMTGNASAPHLHFEIRLGGVNGSKANPYPTLKSAGC
ncbi:MAG: peptidoglycan DD-metalloendopeptidase family protein [Acidimicrobiia bacterium]